jgi:hypothetical protein
MSSDSFAAHLLGWNVIANPSRPTPHRRRRRGANISAWASAMFPHGGEGQVASGKRRRPPFTRCSAASALGATPCCALQPLARAATRRAWRCFDTPRQARGRGGPLGQANTARPDTPTDKPIIRPAMRHPAGRGAETTQGALATPDLDARPSQHAQSNELLTTRPKITAPEPTMITSKGGTVRNPTPDPRFLGRQAAPKTILKTISLVRKDAEDKTRTAQWDKWPTSTSQKDRAHNT